MGSLWFITSVNRHATGREKLLSPKGWNSAVGELYYRKIPENIKGCLLSVSSLPPWFRSLKDSQIITLDLVFLAENTLMVKLSKNNYNGTKKATKKISELYFKSFLFQSVKTGKRVCNWGSWHEDWKQGASRLYTWTLWPPCSVVCHFYEWQQVKSLAIYPGWHQQNRLASFELSFSLPYLPSLKTWPGGKLWILVRGYDDNINSYQYNYEGGKNRVFLLKLDSSGHVHYNSFIAVVRKWIYSCTYNCQFCTFTSNLEFASKFPLNKMVRWSMRNYGNSRPLDN